nr:predicted GPI-anchored protein 58 [Aegilops tauschii subsp. strangulata]
MDGSMLRAPGSSSCRPSPPPRAHVTTAVDLLCPVTSEQHHPSGLLELAAPALQVPPASPEPRGQAPTTPPGPAAAAKFACRGLCFPCFEQQFGIERARTPALTSPLAKPPSRPSTSSSSSPRSPPCQASLAAGHRWETPAPSPPVCFLRIE